MDDQIVDIKNGTESLSAYFAASDKPNNHAVIVIHEVWGLNEHTKDVARRFSREGYNVLAPDLLQGTELGGGVASLLFQRFSDPKTKDEAQKELREKMAPIHSPEFARNTISRIRASIDWLSNNGYAKNGIAVVGFCFGGTYTFAIAMEDDRVKAAIPFYGHSDLSVDELRTIACPVMAFYGEKDTGLTEKITELVKNMSEAGIKFDYKIYPNTGHAFFNDTNPSLYDEAAAKDSWIKTLDFLSETLA